MLGKFRVFVQRSLITGILATLPLIITFWVIKFLFDKFSSFFLPYLGMITRYMDIELHVYVQKIISFIIILILLVLIGVAAKHYVGKVALRFLERIADKIPVVRSIYSSIQQIVHAVQTASGGSFQKVVIVEYPRKGIYTMGLLARESSEFLNEITGEVCLNVFVPTTPNPTSGFVLIVPKSEIIDSDISIDDGIKFIISGGLVDTSVKKSLPETERKQDVS
ncbi:DUF502 domain-containing protein [Seleniivibrio woodruffii]|uniref:DUF502 domain-containing protein n=1 Tax=Seleniivibrio woodruffii TaxID=1078050 RepID=UPI0026EEC2D8|nr:DUF502 domain-containing protein [Seleniivibrio woodruffii]